MRDKILELIKNEKITFTQSKEENTLFINFNFKERVTDFYFSFDKSYEKKILKIAPNLTLEKDFEEVYINTSIEDFNLLTNEQKVELVYLWVEDSDCECTYEYVCNLIDDL